MSDVGMGRVGLLGRGSRDGPTANVKATSAVLMAILCFPVDWNQ